MGPYRIAFVSLGCAKNLVNTEQMMALCRQAGHTITGDPEGADVAVLNTCGFIESAKSEAIEQILELARLKDQGKLGRLLVAGCLSQRYPDDIRAELPEVDGLLGTGSYTDVVTAVEELMAVQTFYCSNQFFLYISLYIIICLFNLQPVFSLPKQLSINF